MSQLVQLAQDLTPYITYVKDVLSAAPAVLAGGVAGNAAYDVLKTAHGKLKNLFGSNMADLEEYAAQQDEASLNAVLKMLLKNDEALQKAIAELAQQFPLPEASSKQTNIITGNIKTGNISSKGSVNVGHTINGQKKNN